MIEQKGYFDYLQFFAGINATLLSLCIAIAAILPTLIQLLKEKNDFFENTKKKILFKKSLSALIPISMGFSLSLLFSILGLFWPTATLLVTVSAFFLISLIALVAVSIFITKSAKELL